MKKKNHLTDIQTHTHLVKLPIHIHVRTYTHTNYFCMMKSGSQCKKKMFVKVRHSFFFVNFLHVKLYIQTAFLSLTYVVQYLEIFERFS